MEEKKKKLFDKKQLDPFFDRQMRIPEWDQKKMEKQVALCLGIGGLGSQVALDLCRLGIKKIYLIDYDIVDNHNLNRQLLYSKKHIGKSKVKCAKETLDNLHNIKSEIVIHDINVLDHFDTVVDCFKDSTIVFNMIDLGDNWDLLVQSTCMFFNLCHINGGTMQNCLTFDYHPPEGPCVCCLSSFDGKKDEEKKKLFHPKNVVKYKKLDFIKRPEMPIGASNVIIASTCSNFMISLFIRYLFGDKKQIPNRSILYMSTFEFLKWPMDCSTNCFLCALKNDLE